MPSLEIGLVALLKQTAAFTQLVGARIYPVVLPEDYEPIAGAPACTYQIITWTPETCLTGETANSVTIQFDLWGATYYDTLNAHEALTQILHGYSDVLPNQNGFVSVEWRMGSDQFYQDARVYRRMNEFWMLYRPQV